MPCENRTGKKKAGLTFARKKGIEDCKYEYIIFCDDDNWLSSNFVSEAFKILSENIKCGIAGGRLLPQFETEKPRWFDSYQLFYTVGEKPVDPGDVTDRCVIPGAGMITRKSIWLKVLLWVLAMLIPLSLVLSLHPNFHPRMLMAVVAPTLIMKSRKEPN